MIDLASVRERLVAFYAAYAEAVDDDLDRWPSFFTDDADYRVQPRENYERGLPIALMRCEGRGMLLDRVVSVRKTSVYGPRYLRHLVSGVHVVEERGAELHVRSNFAVFESRPQGQTALYAAGRYFDVVVRDGDALLFKSKICVIDGDLVRGSLIYPL